MKNLIQQSVEDSINAKNKKQVCFAMGGHVIKTGMSPIIIDLMKKSEKIQP